ncbi:hypothetical protein [Nostoc sp.]
MYVVFNRYIEFPDRLLGLASGMSFAGWFNWDSNELGKERWQ